MQGGKNKNEINLELDEIPVYLRASIQKIIDRRVTVRIEEEMKALKLDVASQLAD